MKTMELFHVAFEDQPQHVATLSADYQQLAEALDFIYRATQNVDSSWVEAARRDGSQLKPSDSVLTLKGCRSTSVGDYVRVLGEEGASDTFWRCAPFGWNQIRSPEGLRLVREAATMAGYRSDGSD
jgi:hypothetical protein